VLLALLQITEATMKNILLLVHRDSGQEARLQAALDLTRALGGHLRCIDVTPPIVVSGGFSAAFGEAGVITDESESEARNKAALTSRLMTEDVSWDWIDAYGDIASCVLNAASLADLVVLSRELDDFPLASIRDIASSIVMHARVPIVAVPEGLARFDATGKAVIAWDGQASAIATMRACVPLLSLAQEVEVFAITEEAMKAQPDDAAIYLSRHGIAAQVRSVPRGDGTVAGLVADECTARGAAYLLMGAYNHGRLVEAFGGTTRQMLSDSAVPLILGH
jgi:nucleotide-binding universal stress UspA family protein